MSRKQLSSALLASARRIGVAAGLGATIAVAAMGSAQAFGGPGPGMRGPGFGPQMLETIKGKLNLNSSQITLYDAAVAQGKAAREAARAEMLVVREAMRAELAKTEPNLAAMAARGDEARAKGQAARNAVRDTWLKLYETFSPEQKAVVKEFMTNRMNRAEGFRQKMRERGPYRGG